MNILIGENVSSVQKTHRLKLQEQTPASSMSSMKCCNSYYYDICTQRVWLIELGFQSGASLSNNCNLYNVITNMCWVTQGWDNFHIDVTRSIWIWQDPCRCDKIHMDITKCSWMWRDPYGYIKIHMDETTSTLMWQNYMDVTISTMMWQNLHECDKIHVDVTRSTWTW